MTCAQAAEIFENALAERAGKPGRYAMRYTQMQRIAERLRKHPDEQRFDDDVRETLPNLDSLQLIFLEMALQDWWPND